MLKILKTNSENSDFLSLLPELDAYLRIMDGDEHAFFAQYNKVDTIKNVVVAYLNDEPVGCGAFKPYEGTTVEIKRMFVKPEARGQGIAAAILLELEHWAAEIGFTNAILETGIKMVQAQALYQKQGYTDIPRYGQYIGVAASVCLGKTI